MDSILDSVLGTRAGRSRRVRLRDLRTSDFAMTGDRHPAQKRHWELEREGHVESSGLLGSRRTKIMSIRAPGHRSHCIK